MVLNLSHCLAWVFSLVALALELKKLGSWRRARGVVVRVLGEESVDKIDVVRRELIRIGK